MSEMRSKSRKSFFYYMRLTNARTQEIVGHLSDISSGGFKLDAEQHIPQNTTLEFQLALPPEIASKSFIAFQACSKWCQSDPIEPLVYNVGFQITRMSNADRHIFESIVDQYGSEK